MVNWEQTGYSKPTGYKILMTLMAMEIGGAETHVLELCKALKREGLDVYVASNGGAYVQELEECGVKHFQAPLHNKKLKNIFTSYKILERIITEHQIQLVHAHARIPAFVCSLLARKLGFRLVTTVHWDFNVTFPWNILSRWGDRSLAVSEDLKQYLMDNYQVPAENIIVTINGIDTEKFSPKPAGNCPDNRPDDRPDHDPPRIIHVSRMDKKVNRTTYKLMDAVESLRPSYPGLELVIVGGGNDEDNIFEQAKTRNAKAGVDFIRAAGRRTDVNGYLWQGGIFVGISRAALEAMSCGLPVILAGDTGYIGIFDESKLSIGVETNFTCRGCPETGAKQLAADLKAMLEKPEEERRALGLYGRAVVRERYSVDRMSRDALNIYETVRFSSRPVDAVISGYYGFNNNGDDVVLQSIVEGLREARPGLRLTVLTKKPGETKAVYGVDVVNRFNFLAVARLLRRSKMLITGGGSLIQDVTSTKSLTYYLWLINRARKSGARNMLYANGIGPIWRSSNMERVRAALNRVDLITLRDETSRKTLASFGVTRPEIHVTADAAYSLTAVDGAEAKKRLEDLGLGKGEKYFGVAVRSWKYNKAGFELEVARFADYIRRRYHYAALFIPMRPVEDTEISRRIMSLMQEPALFWGEKYTTEQITGVVGGAEFMLGMRLHTLIYAARRGTPAIGLVYDGKIKVAMEAMGQPFYRLVEDFTWEELQTFADEILADKENISGRVAASGQEAREKANQNIKLCLALLDKPLF